MSNVVNATKELVTIEFRFRDEPVHEGRSDRRDKIITIGVYDTLEEAIIEGNKALEVFEKRFKLNVAWNRKERFGHTNGCFGHPCRLVTDSAYLQTPFSFFAKITRLTYSDVDQTILEVLAAIRRYDSYARKQYEMENNHYE